MRVVAIAVVLAAVGCSFTSPEAIIVETSPEPDAVDVDRRSGVSVRLRTKLDLASFDADSFRVFRGEMRVRGTLSTPVLVRDGEDGALVWYTRVAFQPERPLLDGERYTATISGTIRDDTGRTLGNDYSWSFVAHRRSWQSGIPGDTRFVNPSDIRLATRGDRGAVALWPDPQRGLVASVHADDRWKQPEDVWSVATDDISAYALGAAESEDVIVAWIQREPAGSRVWTRSYTGGHWLPTGTLGEPGVAEDGVAVAIAPDGGRVVVWSTIADGATGVWASRYDKVSGWAAPEPIAAELSGEVAILGAWMGQGRAHALLTTFDGEASTLWAASAEESAAWTMAAPVERLPARIRHSRLVVNDSATALALTWVHTGREDGMGVKRWTLSDGWEPFVRVDDRASEGSAPAIAVDSDGAVALGWSIDDEGWLAQLTDAGLSEPSAIALQREPMALDLGPEGDVLVVGATYLGTEIVATIHDRSGGSSSPVIVGNTGHTAALALARSTSGTALAVWVQGLSNVTLGASVYR